MKRRPDRCVIVEWHDAHALGDAWGMFEKKDHKPRLITSVGWVLVDDAVGLSITQSIDTLGHDDHGLFIPRCNVKTVQEIKK